MMGRIMNRAFKMMMRGALALLTLAAGAVAPAATYYIDSAGGSNSNTGLAAGSPWRDFSNVNGRTLGPGERLLIRRGSVINQELRLTAKGTSAQWAEIGAYGEGARPAIRRNWQIGDRCTLIRNPDFLRIRSLTFSHAGKGLVVFYGAPGHGGLVIEDCLAHHIEGLYRPNSSGLPEWRDYKGTGDDGLGAYGHSSGLTVVGRGRNITLRDCEVFQNSWGYFVQGEQVTLDRVYCHHNFAFNTSPHPALVGVKNTLMKNCVFDASGYHAFAGTMGIMLVSPQGLTIRNCTFRNQPDSGCHDEGGIDFEANGDGITIDGCTFQNNAGAAIEVLGLKAPQPKNVTITNSRFIKNNWAKKLGPAEIFVWGMRRDPKVCCSTGTIRDNGYVLAPGVTFYDNKVSSLTRWTLQDNTGYPTVEALERAMPLNNPPAVEAGADITTDRLSVRLAGKVTDDGKPAGGRLATRWEVLEGPGTVTFKEPASPASEAVFGAPGDYQLRLVGDDGELWTSGQVTVHVTAPGASVAQAWEFNRPLDKEGWSEADLGTSTRTEKDPQWPCISYPVHYVAGGCYIVAIENAPAARLLSADNLNLALGRHKTVRLRMQNHTSATRMTLRFTTAGDGAWDEAKAVIFDVTPNDTAMREVAVDMSRSPGWGGTLRQLRLDLTDGAAASGTCRIDSIRIESDGR